MEGDRIRAAGDDALLQHVSPVGWRHIILPGDYGWHGDKQLKYLPPAYFARSTGTLLILWLAYSKLP